MTYLPSGTWVSETSLSTSSTPSVSMPPMVSEPSTAEQITSMPGSLVPVVCLSLKRLS